MAHCRKSHPSDFPKPDIGFVNSINWTYVNHLSPNLSVIISESGSEKEQNISYTEENISIVFTTSNENPFHLVL